VEPAEFVESIECGYEREVSRMTLAFGDCSMGGWDWTKGEGQAGVESGLGTN
jgi:hypothetical protein